MSAPAGERGETPDGLARMLDGDAISRRAFAARVSLLLGSATAASVMTDIAGAQTPSKTSFVIAQGGDVSRLDPHMSTVVHDTAVSFNVFDNLVSRRRDGRLEPSLATSWELVSPTLWRFVLRRGVTFHSGDPLTAADVKFSIDRTQDPAAKTLVRTVFTTVERVEVSGPHAVLFHTRKPDPLLPARLAFFGGQIIPKGYFERAGADGFNARPVGTGPLRFVEHIKSDRVVLERSPGYWGGDIAAERVIFRAIPETGPRVAALLKGEADLITTLPPDHVERVVTHPGTRVEETLYAGLHLLVVDSRRPPLDNPKVKQALSLAIDREAIIKDMWHARGLVPNGPIPKGDNFYDDARPPLKYDPALARQRLREGGYKGEAIYLESSNGYLTNDKPMSEALISMWQDVGLNVKLEIHEFSVMMQKLRERSFKGLRLGSPASTLGDPDGMMWRLLGPGGAHDTWRHPRFDELGEAARFSIDEEFRRRCYREMVSIFLDYLPWIPIIQPVEWHGVRRSVDWKPYPTQQMELRQFNLKLRRA